ncbi:unnamed protein product [Rotaria sordida]|uniref:Maf-like protein n=1 Tax=Rotaria sordida TaxID=392033 RepID=A0A813VJ02_9BILA|nr:unnamed protein product [Rotaria sordida]
MQNMAIYSGSPVKLEINGSPQREQLLQSIGLNFDIIISDFAEDLDRTLYKENLSQYFIDTTEDKCCHVYQQIKLNENEKNNFIIMGADTMCSLNNVVYGKPCDTEDAFRMLKTFSNNTYQVFTGVCILQGDMIIKTFFETLLFKHVNNVFDFPIYHFCTQFRALLNSEIK